MQISERPTYRLGVDVGGTFTDLVLVNNRTGELATAKVPSTPEDQSIGVIRGIERICSENRIDPGDITDILHGTTVATNAVLTRTGARVGLITTKGYRQVLHVARSAVPGGVGGWIIWQRKEPLAPLELTFEAEERVDAGGRVVEPLDVADIRRKLEQLKSLDIEALTVSLIHSYANPVHEREILRVAKEVMPEVPVSLSSDVIPEMQEYERAETTVVNSYVRPVVSRYVANLRSALGARTNGARLAILRSDGGLSAAKAAAASPVNLLMSGPAGGVAGALWIAERTGLKNLLTFDMGGTSTDVALIRDGVPQTRRVTAVGDIIVRASSIDVRTVGAGGGSIAYVPELIGALRVGPQSAGSVPGPAAYGRGGTQGTVTDANVVLGYFPSTVRLGGDMALDRELSVQAVGAVAEKMGISLEAAAQGIIDIANEHMYGALRLVSVEQGYDPRDCALVAFGGAGPLHASALGRLIGAWPVVIPPGPGVLCAYGDATTQVRDEASQTYVRRLSDIDPAEVGVLLARLADQARARLAESGIDTSALETLYQIDFRYHGQGGQLTVEVTPADLESGGMAAAARKFDELHRQFYTFALEEKHETVNLRAIVQGARLVLSTPDLPAGGPDPSAAEIAVTPIYDAGQWAEGPVYDRAKLQACNRIVGPAIVTEFNSTTLVQGGFVATVDPSGCLFIMPEDRAGDA